MAHKECNRIGKGQLKYKLKDQRQHGGRQMFSKWVVIGLLGIIAACATVIGSPVALDDTNKRLLDGKWVGTFEARGAQTGTVYTTRPKTSEDFHLTRKA